MRCAVCKAIVNRLAPLLAWLPLPARLVQPLTSSTAISASPTSFSTVESPSGQSSTTEVSPVIFPNEVKPMSLSVVITEIEAGAKLLPVVANLFAQVATAFPNATVQEIATKVETALTDVYQIEQKVESSISGILPFITSIVGGLFASSTPVPAPAPVAPAA